MNLRAQLWNKMSIRRHHYWHEHHLENVWLAIRCVRTKWSIFKIGLLLVHFCLIHHSIDNHYSNYLIDYFLAKQFSSRCAQVMGDFTWRFVEQMTKMYRQFSARTLVSSTFSTIDSIFQSVLYICLFHVKKRVYHWVKCIILLEITFVSLSML